MSNDQDRYNGRGNPFRNLISSAIGMAPLLYSAHKFQSSIRGNAALNPGIPIGVGRKTGGNIPDVAGAIGERLASAVQDTRGKDLGRLKSLVDEIMDHDKVTKLFQSVSEQQALVQSLLETMDDPSNELGKNVLLGYREKLVDLARDATKPDELREVVQTVVQAINTQTPDNVRLRWAKNLREFRKLGPVLTPPSEVKLGLRNTFNPVDPTSINAKANEHGYKAKQRYQRLTKDLEAMGGRVEMISNKWGGVDQYYARVYAGSSAKSFIDVVPLELTEGDAGFKAVFSNENLTTGYAAPRHMVDARKAREFMTPGRSPSDVTAKNIISHAGTDIEDYFINHLSGKLKGFQEGKTSLKDLRNDYRTWRRQNLTGMQRIQYSGNNQGVNQHLGQVVAAESNYAVFYGLGDMTKEEQQKFGTFMGSSVPGFGGHAPGYQYLAQGIGYEPFVRIGMHEDSPLASLRSVGVADREYFPLESRIEQVFHGGGAMFVTDQPRRMGRGGVLHAGPTAITRSGGVIEHLDENLEWASNLTGATNKAVLLPTKSVKEGGSAAVGRFYTGLEGTGAAYSTGKERARMFTSKAVIDPASKGYRASTLMDEILHETTVDASGKTTKRLRAQGEEVRLTREQIERHGAFLGFGPEGSQHLRMDPRMTDMVVSHSVVEEHGKRTIHVTSMIERDMDVWKGFALGHKGGVISKEDEAFMRDLLELGVSKEDLGKWGTHQRDMMIADPSMLKKGPGMLDLQLRGGYGYFAGDTNWHRNLQRLAEEKQQFSALEVADDMLGKHTVGGLRLRKTVGAVMAGLSEKVKAGHVSAREAGMVLAGVYTHGSKHGIAESDLDKAAEQAFGSHAGAVSRVAREGLALTVASFAEGTGPGDWGKGLGSVEPRFITNLQARLKNMGMSTDQAAEVIADIYANKRGVGGHIKAAGGLLNLMAGVTGSRGVIEGSRQVNSKLKTYTLADLDELGGTKVDKLFDMHPEGFYLDLTTGADSAGTRAIAANAVATFGAAGPILIPGREVSDAMRETFIKQARDMAGNSGDQVIEGEYNQMVSRLLKGLDSKSSQVLGSPDATLDVLQRFKKEAINLGSKTMDALARGKIRGSVFGFAQPYDLDAETNFNSPGTFGFAKKLFKRTKGQATFMDSYNFLSQLNDWMGSSNGSGEIEDAARKAEMFFTSSEEAFHTKDIRKARGIMQIGTRHPEVGLGNITPIQVFRHVEELGKTSDLDKMIFSKMRELNSEWKNITSWQQVTALPVKGDVNKRFAFFQDLVKNLPHWAGTPEGGGSLMIPKFTGEVTVSGMKSPMSVDFGISSAAGGDFDGDQWMAIMMSRGASKPLVDAVKGSAEYLQQDAVYKIKSHLFAEEAKESLRRHIPGDVLEFLPSRRIAESMMKEQAAKSSIGLLEVQLNKKRLALLDLQMTGKADRAAVAQALAVLKVTAEHAVIKGKKLPVYVPFAESLTASAQMSTDLGAHEEFQRVMRDEVFKGSALTSPEGMVIKSVQSGLPWADSIADERVRLQESLDLMAEADDVARITGVTSMQRASAMARHLGASPAEAAHHLALLDAGQTLESGLLLGARGKTAQSVAAGAESMFHRIASSLSNLDKKTMGIAAAGVMGSLAVLGIINHEGYAPRPMVMPGEQVDPNIRQMINQGTLFQPSGVPSQYAQAQPNMTPTVYQTAPNSYQVRGQIPSTGGAGMAANYLGTLPGGTRGSIMVNDQRRAITPNFLDRASGEY